MGGGGRDFEGSELHGGPYEEVGGPVLVGGGGRWPCCPAKPCPDTTCPEDDSWRVGGCIVPEPPAVVHTIDHNDFTGYTCACSCASYISNCYWEPVIYNMYLNLLVFWYKNGTKFLYHYTMCIIILYITMRRWRRVHGHTLHP